MVVLVQRLTESLDCAQRGSQVVRDGVRECLQFLVRGLELQTGRTSSCSLSFLANITGDFSQSRAKYDVRHAMA